MGDTIAFSFVCVSLVLNCLMPCRKLMLLSILAAFRPVKNIFCDSKV